MDIKTNKNGVNIKIKANILPDKEMKTIGFTDYSKNIWYFMRMIKGVKDISFNVSINKNNSNDLSIDILDENFCQPYDYQYMLEKNPKFKPCLIVKEEVEKWMKYLDDSEVLTGHIYGEYI
jgi:hypothetical protein